MPIISQADIDKLPPLPAEPPPTAAELHAVQLQQTELQYQAMQQDAAVLTGLAAAGLVLVFVAYRLRHVARRQLIGASQLIARAAYALGIADTRAIAARWRERR